MRELPLTDQQVFTSLYDRYAPKLWGLILVANLSTERSETILMNTFLKAGQQFNLRMLPEKQILSDLLRLAYQEGLPVHTVTGKFNR